MTVRSGPLRGPLFEGSRVAPRGRCGRLASIGRDLPPLRKVRDRRPLARDPWWDAYGFLRCVRFRWRACFMLSASERSRGRRQARARQHFLCLRPLPQGHGSFLPTLRPECEDGMGVPDFQS